MAKTSPDRVKQEGFAADQFGGDAVAFDTVLTGLVSEAGNWAQAKVGATAYTAASSGYALDLLVRAETQHVAATLWKRRASFHDGAAHVQRESPEYLERREYLAHASAAWQCALDALREAMQELGVDASALHDVPAFASGYIETGRWPQTSEAPLNG